MIMGRLITGVVLIILGFWAIIAWWDNLVELIKGCAGIVLVLLGALIVVISRK